jgi:hypothetical protein
MSGVCKKTLSPQLKLTGGDGSSWDNLFPILLNDLVFIGNKNIQ